MCLFFYSSPVLALDIENDPFSPSSFFSAFLMEGFSSVVEKTSPAVVSVLVSDKNEQSARGQEKSEPSIGSGVLIDPGGYIVTNNHVVKNRKSILIKLQDKRQFQATVVGTDQKTDLAVIKIDAKNLPYLHWGNYDELKVGHIVIAIGTPFGLNSTVTLGIISALGRSHVNIADYEDFIQTDAAINPGNSGGALVNMRGELIGINTAIFSQTGQAGGIGFAIPTSIAIDTVNSLIKTGKVVRGWTGISVQEINSVLAKSFGLPEGQEGVLVSDVNETGPSHEAGIIRGDIIVEFNGKKIAELSQFRNLVAKAPLGKKALMKVVRDGKTILIEVEIKERPTDEKLVAKNEPSDPPPQAETKTVFDNVLAGLTVENTSEANASVAGVVIANVLSGSPAEQAGIMKGDVIVEVNHMKVTNIEEYSAVSKKIAETEIVLVLVSRKGTTFFVSIEPK